MIAFAGAPTRRRAIPTRTKKARVPAVGRARAQGPAARRRGQRSATSRRTSRPSRPRAEQPLGVGVADAFALDRLEVPQSARRKPSKGVREIGWAEFGELARALADGIAAEYRPDVVLGIVNGGVFLGGALAAPLKAEFHPVRVGRIGKRVVVIDRLGDLHGKAVLIADDVTASGKTLASVSEAARRAGARETRTATLVVRPTAHRSDFHALDTTDVIVFGWDYQLHGGATGGVDPGDVGV